MMNISDLTQAVQTLNADDAMPAELTDAQWVSLAPYLTRHEIAAGDLLIREGDVEQTMYLLESGSLQVFVTLGTRASRRIAILRSGSIVGEGGLFSDGPRMAHVEALTPCVLWALKREQLEQVSLKDPALALALVHSAASVMAVRMRANLERNVPMS